MCLHLESWQTLNFWPQPCDRSECHNPLSQYFEKLIWVGNCIPVQKNIKITSLCEYIHPNGNTHSRRVGRISIISLLYKIQWLELSGRAAQADWKHFGSLGFSSTVSASNLKFQQTNNKEIRRKLCGSPAWTLLAEKPDKTTQCEETNIKTQCNMFSIVSAKEHQLVQIHAKSAFFCWNLPHIHGRAGEI